MIDMQRVGEQTDVLGEGPVWADRPSQRSNDGKCDRQGRFWAGTMNDTARQPDGTLFLTTAAQRLSPEELAKQPLAGALLAMGVGVRGLPETRFAG